VNAVASSRQGGPLWRTRALKRSAFWWSFYPPERVQIILVGH
jgi:hypothetical protein